MKQAAPEYNKTSQSYSGAALDSKPSGEPQVVQRATKDLPMQGVRFSPEEPSFGVSSYQAQECAHVVFFGFLVAFTFHWELQAPEKGRYAVVLRIRRQSPNISRCPD